MSEGASRPLTKTQCAVVGGLTGAVCGAGMPLVVGHSLLLQTVLTVVVFLVVFVAVAYALGASAGFDLPVAYWLLMVVTLAASLACAIVGFQGHAVVAWVLLGLTLVLAVSANRLRRGRVLQASRSSSPRL